MAVTDNWLSNQFVFKPDVEAYLTRIGFTGTREVSLTTLQEIQWKHLLAIPFEDLDVHLVHKIDLTPSYIEKKLVYDRRGGYCYENNIYLLHVLKALGFDVTPVLARTRWQKPLDIINPTTHLVLKVKLSEVLYMFDVGFSSFGSPFPLEIETEKVQTTPLEPRRVVKIDTGYVHQMKLGDTWHDVFVFTLDESYPFDWEVGSYWVSTAPTSFCVVNIIASMPTSTCRYLLLNKVLKTSYLDGRTETRDIHTEEELFQVLQQYFGLRFPEGTNLCPPNTSW